MPVITQTAELPKASAVQPTKEATPVEANLGTPEAKPQEQKVSAKYLEQARFEKMRRKEAEEFKAKEQAWALKEEEYKSKYIPKEQIEKDAYGTLKSLGWDEQKILNTLMNQPTQEASELQALRAELEELKTGQKKILTSAEETQAKQREQAISMIKDKAQKLIESNPDDYEMIQKTGSHDAVTELIVNTWDTEQRLISEEEAAKEIEAYLLEQTLPLLELNKIKSKLNPPQEAKPQPGQAPMKTLTHNGSPQTQKPLSAMSRRERALLAFKGQLPT